MMDGKTNVIEEKTKLENIIQATNVGTWECDLRTGEFILSDTCVTMLGYEMGEIEFTIRTWKNFVHPDDINGISHIFRSIFHNDISTYEMQMRMLTKSGAWIWILDKGNVIQWDENNKPQLIAGIQINITQLKEMNLQLNDKEKEIELILNSTATGIFSINKNGVCTYVNKATINLLGYEHESELLGKNVHDLIKHTNQIDDVSFQEKDYDLIQTALQGHEHHQEGIIWCKDQTFFHISYTISPRIENNDITGMVITFKDITQKKLYENALIESKDRFQKLFDYAPLGYQSLNIDETINDVNQTWLVMFGYSKYEVIGQWFGNFLTKESQLKFKKTFKTFKKNGKISAEFEMIRKDNHKIYVELHGVIGYNENHEFERTYCNITDITKRKVIQEKLEINEYNLKTAQEIAKVGSWEYDINSRQLKLSDESLRIYEINSRHDYINYDLLTKYSSPEDVEKNKKAIENLIKYDIPYNETFKIITKNKNTKYIISKAKVLRNSNHEPIKVIGSTQDVTDLKNKQLELEFISHHDYLTDLYNRRYYFNQFSMLDQKHFYPLGVMMLDVNGLKIINDAFGHAAGDLALQTISTFLKETFVNRAVVSRIGGDEFTVLIPNTTGAELQAYKESIVSSVKHKFVRNVSLSLSVGYELKFSDKETIDDIQKRAENHMYKHKTLLGSSTRSQAIKAILLTLTDKYEIEKKHSTKVSELCRLMGTALKFNTDDLNELEQAGLFHDIGKISIPDEILKKPGKLTEEEFKIVKGHTEVGYQILRAADEYSDLAIHALHHHERWDGNGYPSGLKGEDIPLFSRIINVVDSFEAMTADRPYHKKIDKLSAVQEIIRCSGAQFDPKLAKIFVEKILKSKWVELDN